MCYAKPGPRCSGHAKANLEKAVAANDPAAIFLASDAYDETVKGQREIKDELASAKGTSRYELQARLNSAKHRRKIKIAQYKNRYPEAKITFDGTDDHQDDIFVMDRPENVFYSQEVADMIRDGKIRDVVSPYFNAEKFGIEEQYEGCSSYYGSRCDCCDRPRYDTGDFKAPDIDYVIREIFDMDDKVDVPDKLKEWALEDGFGDREAYDVEIEKDYYGEEDGVSVTLTNYHFAKLRNYFDMYKRAAEVITVR